jgi:hypothetical protein
MAKKRGRPTKYREEYAEQVHKLCLLGATDEQIADFFGVAVSTVFEWNERQPEFSEARRNGKEIADATVAEALYHRAIGYEHDAVQIMAYEGHSFEHPYIKRYPPDTAAAFIWLKNRAGWSDRQDVNLRTPDGIQVEDLSPAELRDRKAQLANRVRALTTGTNGTNGKRNGAR